MADFELLLASDRLKVEVRWRKDIYYDAQPIERD